MYEVNKRKDEMTALAKHSLMTQVVVALLFTSLSSQSPHWAWKEHVYSHDGFAITIPLAFGPAHRDPSNHSITVYTLHFTVDSGLTLRVDNERRDCGATLSKLKYGALHNKQPKHPINSSSVKDVSLGEYPGLEYEFTTDPDFQVYDRYYCVEGRFYLFSAQWPSTQPRPAAVNRAIQSFRILK